MSYVLFVSHLPYNHRRNQRFLYTIMYIYRSRQPSTQTRVELNGTKMTAPYLKNVYFCMNESKCGSGVDETGAIITPDVVVKPPRISPHLSMSIFLFTLTTDAERVQLKVFWAQNRDEHLLCYCFCFFLDYRRNVLSHLQKRETLISAYYYERLHYQQLLLLL